MINGHGDDVYRYNEVKINFSSNVYGHFSHIDLFSYLSSQLYKVSHYPERDSFAFRARILRSDGHKWSDRSNLSVSTNLC